MPEIPLQIINLEDDGFHLLVEVAVFGKYFKAVLDTGASRTVLDKTLLGMLVDEQLLQLTDKLSTGLGTTTMESFTVRVPEFCIGELNIRNFVVAVIDLSSINYAYEKLEMEPVIGVIGGDLLMSYEAVIDYKQAVLKLTEGGLLPE